MASLRVSERRIGGFVLISVSLGFIALVVAVGGLVWATIRGQEHRALVEHTYQVERTLAEFETLTERLESGRRGYLLTGERVRLEVAVAAEARLPKVTREIEALVADNPEQRRRARALEALSRRQRASVARSIELAGNGDFARAITEYRAFDAADPIFATRATARRMIAIENLLLERRNRRQDETVRRSYLFLAIAGALLLIVAAATLVVLRRYTRDLTASRDALGALNANLEGAVRERTADLQRANDEIQRFAYIVSHDLRAPLVNIMGFTSEVESAVKPIGALIARAETEAPALVTEDARVAAREDLPEAVGFIRSSTQKMDRLINAILKLSREGQRIISPEPIDMAAMLTEIGASLHHRTEEIGAEMRIEAPLPDIVSDRLAIEQIFSNLIENAVKYRAPERPLVVTARGAAEGARVWFEIADNGRGIDPRDHDRIFDLFRRSGAQTEAGEGIGLAHVRALVYRLGGTIACESKLGEGAIFRVTLPRTLTMEEQP